MANDERVIKPFIFVIDVVYETVERFKYLMKDS